MTDDAAPRAGRKEWIGLAVLAVPALLAATDLSMVFMAAPWISADLEPTGSQLLWIMDIYGFVLAGLLITVGTLGDRIGRRRLLMIGAVVFGGASLLAAFSTSAEMLIAARALLGVGAATLAPTTLALVRQLFRDERQLRTAIGIWAASWSAGFPLGALLGGLLIEHFWWGSVFLVNVPVAALLLVLAPLLLPESTDPRPGRLDLFSAALAMASVLTLIWALKQTAEHGWNLGPIAVGIVGLVSATAFVRRQRRLTSPLIDVTLFRRPAFSGAIGANTMLALSSAALGMLAFQHLQLVLGYRPFVTALWMVPVVAATMVGIAVATGVVRHLRPAIVVGTGLVIAAIGFALFIRLEATDTLATVLLSYGILTFGMGMVTTLAYDLMIAAAPREQAGAATGVNETGTELGSALGIAVLGTIATTAYRNRILDTVPDSVPAEVADIASGSLGGATAAAEALPPALAAELLTHAHDAFTAGINLTASIATVLLIVTAVTVTIALRNVRLDDTPTQRRDR